MLCAQSLLNGVDARFDTLCLAQKVFALDATQLRLRWHESCTPAQTAELQKLALRRAAGEPLQYILGEWEFFGLPFFVGEGVLIPRPETELLVTQGLQYLERYPQATVLDLCAGSGCIGLCLAARCPGATVYLAETQQDALLWLHKNAQRYAGASTHIKTWDALQKPSLPPQSMDVILTNPPYIPTRELPGLQTEVQREPGAALDGGADGLLFYRSIAENWLPLLRPGGLLAIECGDGQAPEIAQLFTQARQLHILHDATGIARVVVIRI
jgi:release factor glutamine methyltransferase